jgi:outer membrane protein OmpA-like peptidoglycan-associated protein
VKRRRVHADSRAADSAAAAASLAYTVGNHVVLGRAADVSQESGRRILAHELIHTLQQAGERASGIPARLEVASPDSAAEREAERAASSPSLGTIGHGQGPTQSAPVVQRTCSSELGTPVPACDPSTKGVGGWQFLFKVGCDELLPGEAAKIDRFKVGNSLEIHGFASRDGTPKFNDDLSCHRANRIADLARAHRADCPVVGTYRHGASPTDTPGRLRDPNPPDFWRSVIVQEIPPTLGPGEQWLDPTNMISKGWALYARAQRDPVPANLDVVAGLRPQLKTWLESISRTLAPEGAQLTQRNLSDYRRIYSSAEHLWTDIDQLLALQRHPAATSDTYQAWAAGTGRDQGSKYHAAGVPAGARYHVDIFGEGYYPGAVNIGMATRTSTTGVFGTRVPNLIYRKFSGKDLNQLPIADHAADLVTSENGPLGLPGLAEEVARIIAPGGTIVLYGPENMEPVHDKIARLTGGTVTKDKKDGALETRIAVPAP